MNFFDSFIGLVLPKALSVLEHFYTIIFFDNGFSIVEVCTIVQDSEEVFLLLGSFHGHETNVSMWRSSRDCIA